MEDRETTRTNARASLHCPSHAERCRLTCEGEGACHAMWLGLKGGHVRKRSTQKVACYSTTCTIVNSWRLTGGAYEREDTVLGGEREENMWLEGKCTGCVKTGFRL